MKSKYFFALILILTILFSLGTVVASENIDFNTTHSNDAYLAIDIINYQDFTALDTNSDDAQDSISDMNIGSSDNQISLDDDLNNQKIDKKSPIREASTDSSADGVDLSVDMELGDVEKNITGFNKITFYIPLIITAKVSNGTAYNTKVNISMPENFEYVTHNKTIGEYNPESGIWTIGDFDASGEASLTIFTKLNTKGTFVISVNATTDSNDVNLTNNALDCNIEASTKITSHTTRTSADSGGPQHDIHQGSSSTGGFIVNDTDSPNGGSDSGGNGGSNTNGNVGSASSANGNSNGNGGSSFGANSASGTDNGASSSANPMLKRVNSNIFSSTVNLISDAVSGIFNQNDNSNNNDSNNSLVSVAAKSVYDYTQVPILIFGLFLVVLLGMLAYDKVKS